MTSILASGLLAGCGSGPTTDATDPSTGSGTPSGRTSASPQSGDPQSPGELGAVESSTVDIISATSASGEVDHLATVLDGPSAIDSFSQQFAGPQIPRQLRAAVDGADLAAGQTLIAAVVSIGCDVPSGVTVQRVDDGLRITPTKVASPKKECFAPITAVALVAVGSADV